MLIPLLFAAASAATAPEATDAQAKANTDAVVAAERAFAASAREHGVAAASWSRWTRRAPFA